MKISYQILIIIFVLLSLFVVKDDVKVAYNRAVSYIEGKINKYPDSSTKDNILIKAEQVSSLFKKVITPGALKVTDSITSDTANVKLSVKDVIALTNSNRASNGNLPALKENSKLDFSAQIKLNDMFKQQYFEHISPDGIGVSDLGDRVSYEYIVIGENLALGNFKDAKALLDAWMASPGHRANILNKSYTEIGVAVGRGMFDGHDTWLAVQHFGLPRSACPSINEALHGIINLNQKDIKALETDLSLRRSKIDSGVIYAGKTPNEQITDYNSLVLKYNQMLLDLKQKISQYNTGVRAFNTCLSTNTSGAKN